MLESDLLCDVDFISHHFFWAPCLSIKYCDDSLSLSLVTDLEKETVLFHQNLVPTVASGILNMAMVNSWFQNDEFPSPFQRLVAGVLC